MASPILSVHHVIPVHMPICRSVAGEVSTVCRKMFTAVRVSERDQHGTGHRDHSDHSGHCAELWVTIVWKYGNPGSHLLCVVLATVAGLHSFAKQDRRSGI